MRAKGKRAALPLLLLVGAVSTVACVDEDVVFDERPGFQEVAEEAGGFVGYADPSSEDELTVCGACHTGTQAQWEATAHSDAWAALQQVGQLAHLVLRLRHGHAVARHDDDFRGIFHDIGRIFGRADFGVFIAVIRGARGSLFTAKSAEQHGDKGAVHAFTHDVRENSPRCADKRACNNQ